MGAGTPGLARIGEVAGGTDHYVLPEALGNRNEAERVAVSHGRRRWDAQRSRSVMAAALVAACGGSDDPTGDAAMATSAPDDSGAPTTEPAATTVADETTTTAAPTTTTTVVQASVADAISIEPLVDVRLARRRCSRR